MMRRLSVWILCGLASVAVMGEAAAKSAAKSAPAAVQKNKPLAIALYPKGQVVTEINLSEKDLLPMFKEVLNAAPKIPMQGPGGKGQEIDFAELGQAFRGLKRVRVLIYRLQNAPQPADVARFYADSLKKQGWSQVLWTAEKANDIFSLHTLGQKGGIFFLNSRLVRSKTGSGWTEVTAGRTEGIIDMAHLMRWFGKIMAAEQTAPPKEEPAAPGEPAKPPEPFPEPAGSSEPAKSPEAPPAGQ